MSNNQDPNQHIMYPQSYQSYPAGAAAAPPNATMGTWGQPQPQVGAHGVPEAIPNNLQQPVPYAFPYQTAPDMGSYNDKSGYGGAYPVQYGGGDADYYRQNYYAPQQAQSNQWAQGSYPGFSNQPMYGTYPDRDQFRGGAFSAAQLPNMSRPPPNIKNENTFHTSLSLLENPAQSAAAYTASWVSSTSSIPPELKDEPEVFGGLDPVFSPLNDQFAGMQLTEAQKEASRKQQQQQQQGDRRPREEPRELTWEERLRKAQVQKERVEHRGGGGGSGGAMVEREPKPERDAGTTSRGGGNGGGSGQRSRGGPVGSGGPRRGENHRQPRQHHQQHQSNTATAPMNSHMMWKNSDTAEQQRMGGEHEGHQPPRPNYNRQPPQMGTTSPMQQTPHVAAPIPVYNQAQAQMMMRNRNSGYNFHRPMTQPQHMMNVQQDERFKNTWLDASAFVHPFPLPFPTMAFGADGNRGGRGRGRGGGRGMNRGGYNRRDYRRDERRDDQSPEEKASTGNDDCVQPLAPPPAEPTSFDSQP